MTIKIVSEKGSFEGPEGQIYLVAGRSVALRLWEEPPGERSARSCRNHETVGFVLEGRAELEMDGQTVELRPGDSWLVPPGALHTYQVFEHFRAVEATSPPARRGAQDVSS